MINEIDAGSFLGRGDQTLVAYLRYLSFKENQYSHLLIANGVSGIPFDAFLENGLKALKTNGHPTVIEFFDGFSARRLDQKIEAVNTIFKNIKNYIFIIIANVSPKGIAKLSNIIKAKNQIIFLGREFVDAAKRQTKIDWILKDFAGRESAIRDSIYFVSSTNGIKWAPREGKKKDEYLKSLEREKGNYIAEETLDKYYCQVFEELSQLSKKNQLSLFLGTGVSLAYGVDDWQKMAINIRDMISPILSSEPEKIMAMLGANSYSTTSYAEFVYETASYKHDYFQAIRNSLYRKYSGVLPLDTTLNGVVDYYIKHNPTTLSFNYDDFFERIAKKVKHVNVFPIYDSESEKKEAGKKHTIIHVHGYLPHSKPTEAMEKSIVLSQEDYFLAYSNESWVSGKITDVITHQNILAIGLSFSDIFLRNLMNRIDSENQESKKLIMPKRFILLFDQNLSSLDKWMVTLYFLKMNIRVAWVKSYNEMQILLRNDFDYTKLDRFAAISGSNEINDAGIRFSIANT
jgi:hypothetical protein